MIHSRAVQGFSLVEIIVVIALIALLATGLGLALTGGGGTGLRAGEAAVAGLFTAARQNAVLHQTEARVIVLDERDDPERGRRLGLIVQAVDTQGVPLPNEWIAVSDNILLPRETLVDVQRGRGDTWQGTMRLTFPRAGNVTEGTGKTWQWAAFDARGRSRQPGTVILAHWSVAPGEVHTIPPTAPRGGFKVFRLGSIQTLETLP